MRVPKFFAVLIISAMLGAAVHASDPPHPPAAPNNQKGAELFPALVQATSYNLEVGSNGLGGAGAAVLGAAFTDAQFVLLGEDHGSNGIALFATALWLDLNKLGFTAAAIETDPWAASFIETSLRRGGQKDLMASLQERGGSRVLPFYSWAGEAKFAESVVATTPDVLQTLWGLDQVFIGSGYPLMRDIAQQASNKAARDLAALLTIQLKEQATLKIDRLTELRTLLNIRRDAQLISRINAIEQSASIYDAFTGGTREKWPANLDREALMKRNFQMRLQDGFASRSSAKRVMIKLGANHTVRGLSPLLVPSFGGFASALAQTRNQSSVHLLVLCGQGGSKSGIDGEPKPCDNKFKEQLGEAAEALSTPGQNRVYDLRVWKQRPSRWQHIPEVTRRLIEGHDYLVIVGTGDGARYLDGIAAPKF